MGLWRAAARQKQQSKGRNMHGDGEGAGQKAGVPFSGGLFVPGIATPCGAAQGA